ncbi:band 7 protein [Acidimicrobium ferrooxidans DSM 10331]|uniref:Band 7 protein n=1 Tax=Acidimicrobium ferrooxidans (strain DSM 10331 / JCM 15462 / NBRC 103882 / ICP) TaxID=525909 RepID=C7M0I6_ACIFD|nr:SPFH domain-containing protein [Acidimicrobium ferrooxidans]ACU54494.1 band 7 protein [Acidimicrobium ferrooxidans DSM 10331]
MAPLIVLGIIVLAALILIARGVRIVREYQRVVVFRLGRAIGAKGPGLTLINPVIDRLSLVDLREQYLEIPHQTAITKDNAPISIDFIMFYKVIDPVTSVVAVRDFSGAALNVAATTLRSIVGDMSLDDVLSRREDMNATLRVKLDEVTERWGVKVSNVEVREINPPPAVQEAMTRQMSAERSRRALVTESEGQRQAAVTVAEGEKQAAILAAEGQKQAAILAAEAERQAAKLRAQGLADALSAIMPEARNADSRTIMLQYLDALRELARSGATTYVIPAELTGFLGQLAGALSASPTEPSTNGVTGH